jgi:ribosomal protein L13E
VAAKAQVILGYAPKIAGQDSKSLLLVVQPPTAAAYDAAAFRAGGCDCAIAMAGFTAAEAKTAGCDVATAKSAGYDLPSIKAAGFDAAAFKAGGCDWAAIKTAGFTLAEAKAAGCDLATAKTLGYDATLLVVEFGYDAVAASGCDVKRIAAFKGRDIGSIILVSSKQVPVADELRTRALTPLAPTSPSA